MRTILKLQKPLSSSDPNPPVLAYNKDRSYETFFYMPAEQILQLFAVKDKVYVKAEIDTALDLMIVLGPAPDQPW